MTARTIQISQGLKLPLDLVTEAIAIVATRGGGKTYLAKRMAEAMLDAGQQVVALDPMGVWWGLRAGADGTAEGGYPLAIFGGEHGDVPLEAEAGTYLADLLIAEGLSAVLDVRLLTKTKRRRFVGDFATRLLERNREPMHLFLEEAHHFAPQKPAREDAAMLGAITELATMGRTNGVGITLVTQRAARLHKDALNICDTLFMLRTLGTQDRKAVKDWIEYQDEAARDEVLGSLPKLKTGSGWIWAPALLGEPKRIDVLPLRSFDSSASPKAGQKRREPKTLADVDLDAVTKAMAATIERAKESDPKHLRAEVARLRAEVEELRQRPAELPPPEVVEQPVPVLDAEAVEQLERTGRQFAQFHEPLGRIVEVIDTANGIQFRIEKALGEAKALVAQAAQQDAEAVAALEVRKPTPQRRSQPATNHGSNGAVELEGGAQRLLDVLLSHHPARLSRGQVFLGAKLKQSGGAGQAHWRALKAADLVCEHGTQVWLSERAAELYGATTAPLSLAEAIEFWRGRLKSGPLKIFDLLLTAPHEWWAVDTIAERVGMAAGGGAFQANLRVLVNNELVQRDGSACIVSQELLP